MNHLKYLAIAAAVALPVMATAFAGVASATTLEVKGVKQSGAVTIKATLERGTSLLKKDELGSTLDTCAASTIEGKSSITTGSSVGGPLSAWIFEMCSHTTHVIAPGSLSLSWIEGTTNGTVISAGAEIGVRSTFFGITATCKTGAGTALGTLTGKGSGQATLDLNATVDCGTLGNSFWTGSYVVTSPEGLGVVE